MTTRDDDAPAENTAPYSVADLEKVAEDLGCLPWDVAGTFAMMGVSVMTLAEFEAALEIWRTPLD